MSKKGHASQIHIKLWIKTDVASEKLKTWICNDPDESTWQHRWVSVETKQKTLINLETQTWAYSSSDLGLFHSSQNKRSEVELRDITEDEYITGNEQRVCSKQIQIWSGGALFIVGLVYFLKEISWLRRELCIGTGILQDATKKVQRTEGFKLLCEHWWVIIKLAGQTNITFIMNVQLSIINP